MKDKTTEVTISTHDVGVHFGTNAVIRRARSGRVIHRTDPRPYGMRHAAICDAKDWAIAHGYVHIEVIR